MAPLAASFPRRFAVCLFALVVLLLAGCPDEDDEVGAPKAADDSYAVDQGSVLTVTAANGLLANDKGKDLRCKNGTFTTNQSGTVVIAKDGSFVYTPSALFSGFDIFAYEVKNDGGEDVGVVLITVNPTLPNTTDDSFNTLAGIALNVAAPGVLANDIVNGGTITAPALDPTVVATTQGGSLLLRADGSFDYTPPVAFTGNDTFSYTLTNLFGTDTSTVTIEVREAPTAVNDPGYVMAPQSTLVVPDGATDLLANDAPGFPVGTLTSFGGGSLGGTVTSNLAGVSVPVGTGSLIVNANGSFTFTPDIAFSGNFTFLYRLSNVAGTSDATVTIDVDPDPTAVDDPNYQATTSVALNVNAAAGLLVNDSLGLPTATIDFFGGGSLGGVVGDNVAGAVVTFGTGSLTVNADGSFSFTSDTLFTGNFTFDYQLTNTASSSVATVTIDVQEAPVAVNDSYATLINTAITRTAGDPDDLLDNDMSAVAFTLLSYGGGSLAGTVTSNVAGTTVSVGSGSLTVNADGSFSFTPDNNFTGNFTFDYRIDNGFGSDDATVTIAVQQAPTANDDSNTASTGTPLAVGTPGLLGNDALGFPPATIASFGGGGLGGAVTDNTPGSTVNFAGGDITVNADGSYTLNTTTFFGVLAFDYRLTNAVTSDDATVTLTVQRVPTAANDSYSTAPGVTLSRTAADSDDLLDNDILGQPTATLTSFGGGDASALVTDSGAGTTITPIPTFSDGSLTVGTDGSFTFVPATGQNGSFSFFYRITNTQGTSDGQVTINLTLAPTFTSSNAATFTVGQAGNFPITASGVPQAGMTITLTSGTLPTGVSFNDLGNGSAELDGTPAVGEGGTYNLQFTADNTVNPAAVQNFVLTVNEAPTFTSAASTTFTVGTPGNFPLTADGFPASFTFSNIGPALPTGLSISGSTLTGTPAAGTGGVYNTLQFEVSNTVNPAGTQNFTLTINEAPTANDDNPGALYTLTLGGTLTRGAGDLFNNNGAGADVLGFPAATIDRFGPATGLETLAGSAGSTTGGTGLTVNADGSFSYTPVASGTHTFVYRLLNTTGSDTATVTITVNEAPVAVADPTGGIPGNSTPGTPPYHIVMNGSIASGSSPNLLANDNLGFPTATITFHGINTGALTTPAGTAGASAQGGTVTVNANGTFSYAPPSATFTGLDSFAYRLANAGGNSDVVVSIAVGLRPTANNENYPNTLVGNVAVNTASSSNFSVSTNDTGDQISVSLTGDTNGTATVNANGTFTFNPDPGFEGAASFTYDVTNGFGSVSGTCNLTVAGMIWFVDDTGAAGDGRLATPFNSLAAFTGITTDQPGDNIFLFSGTFTGGITLLATQRLIGQGAVTTLSAITGLTPPADSAALPTTGGTNPVLNGGITLSPNNTLNGLTSGDGANSGLISGGSFSTLTVANVTVNSNVRPLDLSSGTVSGTFTSVSGGSGGSGILLTNVAGTWAINAGTVTSTITNAFAANNCSMNLTCNASLNGASAAVSVLGGTCTLSFGANLTQASNFPLVTVGGNHTVGSITFQTGTLSATNGTGLQFDNSDGVYNFNGTTTLNGGDAGIDIINDSSGTFSFASGASITNPTGAAVFIANSTGNITFSGTISDTSGLGIDIDNHDGGAVTFDTGNLTVSGGMGIRVQNSTSTINLNQPSKTLNTGASNGVTLTNNAGGTIAFAGGPIAITTTTGTGLSATGGGTISLVGTPNTITTGAGFCISINGVNAHAVNGINFDSCTSTGSVAVITTSTGAKNLGQVSNTSSTTTFALQLSSAGTVNVGSTSGTRSTVTATSGQVVELNNTTLSLNGSGNDGLNVNVTTGTGVLCDGSTVDISGGSLVINTTSGTGLSCTAGTVTVAGTGNTLTTTTGTAVNIGGATIGGAGITFASITCSAASAVSGVILTGTGAGVFTVTGTTAVDGRSTASISFTNTVNATFGVVNITNRAHLGVNIVTHAGVLGFGATTISGVGGVQAAILDSGSTGGSVTFASTTINGAGDAGIQVDSNTGTFTSNGGTITDAAGTSVLIQNGTGSITFSGTITDNNLGFGIDINNHDGGTVTFDTGNLTVSGGIGIRMQSCTSTINFNQPVKTLNTGAAIGVALANNGSIIAFAGGPLVINTTSGTGLFATGGGTISLVGTANTITTTTGTCINLNNCNAHAVNGINFASCESTVPGGAVAVMSTSTGTKTLGRIATTNGAATALSLINAGTVNVGSTNATRSAVTTTTAAAVVLNATTLNLDGTGTNDGLNVTTSAGGTGVSCTGGTVSITGGTLAIVTSTGGGQGFLATSGGTVTVQGSNNTISSGTGTALNIANTTIGAADVTFRSISCNGAVNGIVLNNTGASGNLTVTGSGSAALGGDDSGGTIESTTGAGVSLANTRDVSLRNMRIQNIAHNGIDGTTVTNFSFLNGRVFNTGTAGAGQYNEALIGFNDSSTFTENNISGTVTITGNILSQPRRVGVDIQTWSGTISSLVCSNNTLTGGTTTASISHAILVLAQGSATTNAHVTTAQIQNNDISGFQFFSSPIFIGGSGIFFGGGAGNATNNTTSTLGTAANPIEISGNDIDNVGSNSIAVSFNGQQGISHFNIHDNGTAADPMSNAEGLGISVFFGGSGTFSAQVTNNAIDNNGPTVNAGSAGIGVQLDDGPAGLANATGVATINVIGNRVSNPDGFGIRGIARACNGTLNLKIQNNQVGTPSAANRNAIRVDSGSAAGNVTLLMNMSGNTGIGGGNMVGSGVNAGIGVRKQGTVATTNFFGIHAITANPTNTQVQNYVGGLNSTADGTGGSVSGVDLISGSAYMTCNLP